MMVFRIFLGLTFFAFLFSCDEDNEKKMPISDIVKRRLFEIKRIEKKMPSLNLMKDDKFDHPFFQVTLQNVSSFDFDLHYHKGRKGTGNPQLSAICIHYTNSPNTAECMSFADTSCLIKKNEEFLVYVPILMPYSQFYWDEFQGVYFRLLISSSSDLSFYFEDNPTQTQIPKYTTMDVYDNRKKYTYPFEFTYWVTTGFFWEQHLLE